MKNKPTLVFLHGVGPNDHDDKWRDSLETALSALGYPSLDEVDVVAPKYANALKGSDDKLPVPPVTISQPTRDEGKRNRRDFERRTGAVEVRLGRHDAGVGNLANDVGVDAALALPFFAQARNYLESPHVRASVLERVLKAVPSEGRIVLVGHSLGSVIGADLLRRVSPDVRLAGFVTIGSPLASGRFDVDALRDTLKDPPSNLEWWVNFWNGHDPVAAQRGLSSVFPWMIDLRIHSTLNLHVHSAIEYLSDDVVAEAIGFALFGSRSTELAFVERGLATPLDDTESLTLLALRYAHLVLRTLDGDQKERYEGALRVVQATALEGLRARSVSLGKQLPTDIAELVFDVMDSHAAVPEPRPGNYLSKDEAVVPLTVLAAENVIRPFEISVPRGKSQEAMSDLTAEMSLGTQFGEDVFESAKKAHGIISDERITNWIKIGALGAGAAALVFATGGLALAAAPGLAGAAAITSALAAFGPGGMIGGLITAGSLVGAGGGGVAFGLASPSTSADTFEIVVERQLAAVLLREKQGLDQDPAIWRNLVETEIEVRRQHERLDEFSDGSAPSVKEIKRKITAVQRALDYLRKNGLEPGGLAITTGK